jgi:predicted MFS family arabinose efflux permease
MVFFGLGEILGCFCIGYIVDKYGSRAAAVANMIIMVIMTSLTLAFLANYNFSWFCSLVAFFWGF